MSYLVPLCYKKIFALEVGQDSFDLVLVDLKIEGVDGLQVMTEARSMLPDRVIIILTAYAAVDSANEALRQAARHPLLKPCKVEEIVASVEEGLAKRWQSIRRRELASSIEDSVRQLKSRTVPLEERRRMHRHPALSGCDSSYCIESTKWSF